MSSNLRDATRKAGQEARVREMRQEAARLAGGEMAAWESDALSLDARERFWSHVLEFEAAPRTTNFQQLLEAGVELPEPEALADPELTAKLWEVIERLAAMHVYLSDTDHLSDRELYAALWHDVLREDVEFVPEHPDSAYHVSLVGAGSEADNQLYLKYYADESVRLDWATSFPDDPMPPHEDPPFDRDSLLPQRWPSP